MSKILIIAEHDGQSLNLSTAKTLSCALAIGGDIDIAVLGNGNDKISAQAAELAGAKNVINVSAEHLENPMAETWAPEIVALAAGYSHILGPSTTFGKDLMPRVAALLGVNQVSDVMEVIDANSFRRPIYAGNAIIDVRTPEGSTIVATVATYVGFVACGGG